MEALKDWGPAGIAFGLILLALKDIVLEIVKQAFKSRGSGTADPELARSVDKLAAVLERLEKFLERELDGISENQRRMAEVLNRVVETLSVMHFRIEELQEAQARAEQRTQSALQTWDRGQKGG